MIELEEEKILKRKNNTVATLW